MRQRRFAVLDRDGTIIVERGYLSNPELVELIPGATDGLRRLKGMGLGLIVITNQSGIGRGFFDQATLESIHQRMEELLASEGVHLDGIYFCPHLPDQNCPCRKPKPGLLEKAAQELGFDPGTTFVIGDKPCDIELGQRVGATTFLVRTGYGTRFKATPDYIVDDLKGVSRIVLGLLGTGETKEDESL